MQENKVKNDKIFELYKILEEPKESEKRAFGKVIQWFIFGLISLNIIAVIIGSFNKINENISILLHWFEIFSIIIFTIEYIIRIIVIRKKYTMKKMPYIFSFMGIIDLLSILPFYLSSVFIIDLRFLRVFRLLRIFKMFRQFKALDTIGNVIEEEKGKLGIAFSFLFILLIFASSAMFYIENHYQPDQFANIISTLWWAVATLTTIGYGDVYPVSPIGKLLGGLISVLGIGIIALPSGIISAGLIKAATKKEKMEMLDNYYNLNKKLKGIIDSISEYLDDLKQQNYDSAIIKNGWVPGNNSYGKINYAYLYGYWPKDIIYKEAFYACIKLTADKPYLLLLKCKINDPKNRISHFEEKDFDNFQGADKVEGTKYFYTYKEKFGDSCFCKIELMDIILDSNEDMEYVTEKIKEIVEILYKNDIDKMKRVVEKGIKFQPVTVVTSEDENDN